MDYPLVRMRRLRKNANIRDIVRETKLNKEDLIYPIYFKEGLKKGQKEEISTMPGQYRYSIEDGVAYAKELEAKGLKSIILFGIPKEETKDTIKEKLKTTLEEVNKQKPEIINQTREYPPFAYYAVLDYIERTNKLVKFHKCNEEEKRALVEETLVFLNGLVEEIRDTTPGEKNGLLEAGLNLTYKKKE